MALDELFGIQIDIHHGLSCRICKPTARSGAPDHLASFIKIHNRKNNF
jgi:hypothetical protein